MDSRGLIAIFEFQLFWMQPLVSVLMITHNHAPFIARSIQSVLSQESSFSVELIIGHDASTDSTRDIIDRFISLHPEKIKVVHHPQQIGMTQNFLHTLSRCEGKYIAILDGDDQWIDNKKLEIQVDFLEENPHIIACGGNTITRHTSGIRFFSLERVFKKWSNKNKLQLYDHEEMIVSNRLRSPTVVGRSEAFRIAAGSVTDGVVLDWPLYIGMAAGDQSGFFAVLPNLFAAYSVHQGGVFSGTSFSQRLEISALARENITSNSRGRYLGWHFPVCRLHDPVRYNQNLISEHYARHFSNAGISFSIDDIPTAATILANSNKQLIEKFGFVFALLSLKSKSFYEFTVKLGGIMQLLKNSSLPDQKKEKLLGCLGTAWRDTLFYSKPTFRILKPFILSSLRKYSGLSVLSVLHVCRHSYIKS